MKSDQEMLRTFVETRSENAFREIVERHFDAVLSIATRRLGGDRHLAKDAAQDVFVALAQKAPSIRCADSLIGWLHQHTCYVTANMVRGEQRRKTRERNSMDINSPKPGDEDAWRQIEPMLDEIIENLPKEESRLILLRFFAKHDLESVGEEFGISADAAQKRVSRALEKMQGLFRKRGVVLSGAAAGAFLSERAVEASAAGLAKTVAASAFAFNQASSTAVILNTLVMGKLKLAAVSLGVAVVCIAPYAIQLKTDRKLREEISQLKAQLTAPPQVVEVAGPSNSIAEPIAALVGSGPNPEVLRLRNEVSLLRADLAKVKNVKRGIQILNGSTTGLQPSMESQEARQILTFDSVRDVGLKTPAEAVETYLWTRSQTMNEATFSQANERLKQIIYTRPGVTIGGFGRGGNHDPFRNLRFLKIEAIGYLDSNNAEVMVQNYEQNGGHSNSTHYKLIKEGDEWKVDWGSPGR